MKNSVLTSDDHSIVSDALNIIGGQMQPMQSLLVIDEAITRNLLNDEEKSQCITNIANRITNSVNFVEAIAQVINYESWQTNNDPTALKADILLEISRQDISPEKLSKVISSINDVVGTQMDLANKLITEGVLTNLLKKLTESSAPNTDDINKFADILYHIMNNFILDNVIPDPSIKNVLTNLLNDFWPTLKSSGLEYWHGSPNDRTLWINKFADMMSHIGIKVPKDTEIM